MEGGAKSGSAAGPNSRLLPTAVISSTFHPSSKRRNVALRFASLQSHVKGGFAAATRWRVKQFGLACRTTKPGLGPAADLLLLRRQEK